MAQGIIVLRYVQITANLMQKTQLTMKLEGQISVLAVSGIFVGQWLGATLTSKRYLLPSRPILDDI